ncbi:MAG: hypothetical protein AAB426_04265, partial [Myxococcota bacterium]
LAGRVFDFGPDGTQFQEPIELRISYDPDLVQGDPRRLRLFKLHAEGWRVLPGSSVDTELHIVRGTISSFSIYGIGLSVSGTSTTTRVSVSSAGAETNGDSGHVALASDGGHVALASDATNLVAGDTNAATDVFIHDRDADFDGIPDEAGAITTVRVSVSTAGIESDGDSYFPRMSRNGRHVVFSSLATNLVSGDGNAVQDIFVRDRDTDGNGIPDEVGGVATVRVSVSSAGVEADALCLQAAPSGTGRFVAFASQAGNLIGSDGNGTVDIFVHDRDVDGDGIFDEPAAISTVRVSVASDGSEGDGASLAPTISNDGRFVAFISSATNLIGTDANARTDVFLHDRDTDADGLFDEAGAISTVRASLGDDESEANDASDLPAVSDDGRYVAFTSNATNLVASDGNGVTDVFVRDAVNGTTVRVSVASNGGEGGGQSYAFDMSSDGRRVTFQSLASNLVASDTN